MSRLVEIVREEIEKLVIESHINEIGEANAKSFPFTYKRTNSPNTDYDEIYYEFTTDKDTYYEVSFIIRDKQATITFYGDDELELTNKNEVYSVMTTVVNIIKDFDNKFAKPEGIDVFKFAPIDKDSEFDKPRRTSGNSRLTLYMAYMRKHVGNEFTVTSNSINSLVILTRK